MRIASTVFVLLRFLVISSSATPNCGRQAPQYPPSIGSATGHRIIGGDRAKPHSWPWQISLRLENGNHFCGGSILRISKELEETDLVLTAAHCVQQLDGTPMDFSKWKLVCGTNSKIRKDGPDAGEEWRRVVQTVPHEQFGDGGRYANDLAVVRVDKPIRFSDYVRPICLPESSDGVPVGRTCVVTGWGRNESTTKATPDELQQAISPVYDVETCQKKWNRTQEAWKTAYICAAPPTGASSTCQGDSGGPLVCKFNGVWVQHGIVSFGEGAACKSDKQPPVFTRVQTYVNWIRKKIGELSALARK